jgi:parallel beta-helix repeat protein
MPHPHPLVLSLIITIASICTPAETKSVYASTNRYAGAPDSYGIETSSLKQDVGVIYFAKSLEASTTLAYSSYIFTPEDIVIFSYEDGTQLEVYDSDGNPVSITPNVLHKGQHTRVDTSMGVYFVAGSNKFAVLTGDATTAGTSGYYAMDANGRGVSREFYTYAPTLQNHCEFIVFAYENGTSVTVQQEVASGIYENIASFTLDKGNHWNNSGLSAKYLHIIADKPVSALTCYDQSYFVPSANRLWNGTEFYTCLSDIYGWSEDLTVISYYDNTVVSIKNSDTQELIWQGTLDSGQAKPLSYPGGANKYLTVTSSKAVTVAVQPWVAATLSYYQGTFVPDRFGTGAGTDIISTTLDDGFFAAYLFILAYMDNTQVDVYNSTTGAWQARYDLNMGQYVNANPGNGLWRIKSNKEILAYSGAGNTVQASFAPLIFNEGTYLALEIIDDVNDGDCVPLCREITYTITYDFNGISDSNVVVIDYLPAEVDYNSSSSAGDYNPLDRTVRWNLGTGSGSGSLGLSVTVKNSATPGRDFVNIAEIQGDPPVAHTEVSTFVCYTGEVNENVIYVDEDANGGLKNGSSWDNAYLDFNDALARAPQYVRDLGSCEIWVAGGTYKPTHEEGGDYYYDTFRIPAGNITIRGHFGGIGVYETSPDQRDFNNAAYETIFDGLVGEWERASYVVTCDDIGKGLLLDGLTFTGASYVGLYINKRSDPSITRCKFDGNGGYGIYAENFSYPDVTDCRFFENGYAGIYSIDSSWPYVKNCVFDGGNNNYYAMQADASNMLIEDCIIKRQSYYGMYFANSDVAINHCTIEDNAGSGIYCTETNVEVTNCTIQRNGSNGIELKEFCDPVISNNRICNNKDNGIYLYHCNTTMIKNNWIYRNGDGATDSGLFLQRSIFTPLVRNNTIYGNIPYGIYVAQGFDPCLINDIVYGNGTGPSKNIYSEWGLSGVSASYCCIGGGFAGTSNISCDPCFRNPDANDYRLRDDSNCIDAGSPLEGYAGETDIDGRPRVIYGRVDMGASEWHYRPDYNLDGLVNFFDFAVLAKVWGRTNAADVSLDGDTDVDIDDLTVFAEGWLWNVWRSEADYNYDNIVDFRDFALFSQVWDNSIGNLAKFCEDWLWRFE